MAGKYFTSEGAFSNTDIDDIFAPIGGWTKMANVGYQDAGVDISNLYAPASVGTSPANTGFKTNVGSYVGEDLSDIFAEVGTVPVFEWVDNDDVSFIFDFFIVYGALDPEDPVPTLTYNVSFATNGTYSVSGSSNVGGFSGGPYTGTWATGSITASDFEIELQSQDSPLNLSGQPAGWNSLSTARDWTDDIVNDTFISDVAATFRIRHIPTGTINSQAFGFIIGIEP